MSAPALEAERVADLYAHADPDAVQPPDVEDLVVRAAEVAGVPMATLNLIDADRQCQAATAGFAGAPSPRREAMCRVTLESGTVEHVPDARADPRFADNPWVDGRRGQVRFYASVPLRTRRGHVIGTLCAFDIEPHRLSPDQLLALEQLAVEVVATYERAQTAAG